MEHVGKSTPQRTPASPALNPSRIILAWRNTIATRPITKVKNIIFDNPSILIMFGL